MSTMTLCFDKTSGIYVSSYSLPFLRRCLLPLTTRPCRPEYRDADSLSSRGKSGAPSTFQSRCMAFFRAAIVSLAPSPKYRLQKSSSPKLVKRARMRHPHRDHSPTEGYHTGQPHSQPARWPHTSHTPPLRTPLSSIAASIAPTKPVTISLPPPRTQPFHAPHAALTLRLHTASRQPSFPPKHSPPASPSPFPLRLMSNHPPPQEIHPPVSIHVLTFLANYINSVTEQRLHPHLSRHGYSRSASLPVLQPAPRPLRPQFRVFPQNSVPFLARIPKM